MAEYDEYLTFALELAKKVSNIPPLRCNAEGDCHKRNSLLIRYRVYLSLLDQAGSMIREGQAERFRTLASPECKASSVDVSTLRLNL